MRLFLKVLSSCLLVTAAFWPGRCAYWIGSADISNLQFPRAERWFSFDFYGVEIRGWQMYALPILCAFVSVGLLYAAYHIVFSRRNA